MKATINLLGELHVYAETELEGYAMFKWSDDNRLDNTTFHSNPESLKESTHD